MKLKAITSIVLVAAFSGGCMTRPIERTFSYREYDEEGNVTRERVDEMNASVTSVAHKIDLNGLSVVESRQEGRDPSDFGDYSYRSGVDNLKAEPKSAYAEALENMAGTFALIQGVQAPPQTQDTNQIRSIVREEIRSALSPTNAPPAETP